MKQLQFLTVISLGMALLLFELSCGNGGSNSNGGSGGTLSPQAQGTPIPGSPRPIANGVWGGDDASFWITNNGATVAIRCTHGGIDQQIIQDANGFFDVNGYMNGEDGVRRTARFRGQVTGTTLTFSAQIDGLMSVERVYSLSLGTPANLPACSDQ